MSRSIALLACLTFLLAACNNDSRVFTDASFDTGTSDTSTSDTSTPDTGTPDTSTMMDGGMGDSSTGDGSTGDGSTGDASMDGGGDATTGDGSMDATADATMDATADAMMDAAASCIDMDLAMATGDAVASGDLTGAGDDGMGSCGSTGGEDMAYTWTAPSTAEWTFDTFGSDADTVLHIHTGAECSAAELACIDDASFVLQSRVDLMVTAGTMITIVVDSYDAFSADLFELSITETSTIPTSEAGSCGDGVDNDRDGDVDCFDADCISASTCFEIGAACGDGIDNDGDSDVDCADSDCDGYSACIESICDDSLDDDGDGDVDCADSDCFTDPACDTCPDADLGMTLGTTTGTTTGGTDRRAGSCGGGGEDRTLLFTAPAEGTYTISTAGSAFDTVLYVLDAGCDGLELACNDDSGGSSQSEVVVDLGAGQQVIIVVDGYSGAGDYTLDISDAAMSFGAPGTAGDLVITEIMQNPRTPDTSNEWFEITNTTSSTLNLNGCNISDTGVDSSDITTDLLIAPGEYLVLGRTDDVGFRPNYTWSGRLSLANGDDELIITCGSTEIDRVEWDGGPTFPDPDGASMSLDDGATTATMNDTGSNWCEAPLYLAPYDGVDRATPGEANPTCP